MLTLEVVTKAVQQMSSNKAPSKGRISIELIKYAPRQLHQEISNILNEIFENNDEETKLGIGVLLPIPKPKETPGSLKILRSVALLEVIRKILSKIFMKRMDVKINNDHHRHSRHSMDPPMDDCENVSSTFDTIYRDKILGIAEEILIEDELRILRALPTDK